MVQNLKEKSLELIVWCVDYPSSCMYSRTELFKCIFCWHTFCCVQVCTGPSWPALWDLPGGARYSFTFPLLPTPNTVLPNFPANFPISSEGL
jgi:hypothetical protein